MYDITQPHLVFDTHCHGESGSFTGYIFKYFERDVSKPRELFFSHFAEAQVFAIQKEAILLMNPKAAPTRVGILDFLYTLTEDDSFLGMAAARTQSKYAKRGTARHVTRR